MSFWVFLHIQLTFKIFVAHEVLNWMWTKESVSTLYCKFEYHKITVNKLRWSKLQSMPTHGLCVGRGNKNLFILVINSQKQKMFWNCKNFQANGEDLTISIILFSNCGIPCCFKYDLRIEAPSVKDYCDNNTIMNWLKQVLFYIPNRRNLDCGESQVTIYTKMADYV